MRVKLSRRATYIAAISVALVAAAAGAYVALQPAAEGAGDAVAVATTVPPDATTTTRTMPARPPQRHLSKDAATKLQLAAAQRTADASNAGALFAPKSWYVAPPPAAAPPPPPPVVPTAPPLPYTFMGSYTENGQDTVYFLSSGDRVYDVHLGDTIDQIYSVDGLENGALVFTYKPLSTRQLLALGSGS
jgi:hypothetical protein